jgi:hypothetical protein
MRVPTSDDEIEIRVRFPEEARVLSTLDTLRTRTREGLVPLSNFVTYTPAPQLAEISRVDQSRVFEVKADVASSLFRVDDDSGVTTLGFLRDTRMKPSWAARTSPWATPAGRSTPDRGRTRTTLRDGLEAGDLTVPVTPNERIEALTAWIEAENPFPAGVGWEWAGDQEEQAESQAFLSSGLRRRAGADVHHPAGAVQLGLQRRARAAGRGPVHHRRADRHAGDGPDLLDHHDGHGDRGAGRDRGEQQHRPDRHLPGILAATCPGSRRSPARRRRASAPSC